MLVQINLFAIGYFCESTRTNWRNERRRENNPIRRNRICRRTRQKNRIRDLGREELDISPSCTAAKWIFKLQPRAKREALNAEPFQRRTIAFEAAAPKLRKVRVIIDQWILQGQIRMARVSRQAYLLFLKRLSYLNLRSWHCSPLEAYVILSSEYH